MGLFPKVESACPYKDRLDEIIMGDVCSMCEKNVYDLTHMSESGRREFMSKCSGEVCVSYRMPLRKVVTGAALAAATIPGFAMAQDAPQAEINNEDLYCYSDEIIVGGIREAGEALWIDPEAEKHLTNIPEAKDIADNKEIALLLFALNGTETIEQEEQSAQLVSPETQTKKE